MGNEAFARLSPLRRIPLLLQDGRVFLDSSVICQYLEDIHPAPPLYPADPVDRAHARWLEEYADTSIVRWYFDWDLRTADGGLRRFPHGQPNAPNCVAARSASQSMNTRSRAGICRCGGYSTVIGSAGGRVSGNSSHMRPSASSSAMR